MYESGNALRGIFLTAFVALLLFSSFIFCFHPERPDAMTVEPEMTGYYFYHPDIAVFHPSENNAALTAKDPTAEITAERFFFVLFIRKMRTIDIGSALLSLARTMSAIGCEASNRTLAEPPSTSTFVLDLLAANPAM